MYPVRLFTPWTLTICLIAGSGQTAGQDLSLIGAQGDAIDLPVPASGMVSLAFHRSAPEATSFDIDLSTFLSGDDQPVAVGLIAKQGADPSALASLSFAENQNRAALQLQAQGLVAGVKYVGSMTASSPDGLKSWKVTLYRPHPVAELTVDLKRIEMNVQIFDVFSYLKEQPSFSFVLSEKARQAPVEGITLRRAGESDVQSAFDLEKHLRFFIDGIQAPHLTHWPVSDPQQASLRSIPAGEQRSFRAFVQDLPRGEHKLLMHFDALNAKQGSAPQIELVVHVSHSILWPVLVLLIAISISFFITKGVVNWRQRLKLQERTRSLHREWLQELRELVPVVWLKVTRRQSEMVLENFSLLPAPERLAQQLDKAARLLDLLRRYRDLRHKLRQRVFPFMLDYRMGERLENIVKSIEPDLLDQAQKDSLTAAFDAYQEALADPVPTYEPLVLEARKKALRAVSWPEVESALAQIGKNEQAQGKLASLWKKVTDEPQPKSGLQKLVELDRICAAFRTLQDHLDDEGKEPLKLLVDFIAKDEADGIPIEKVFDLSNKIAWGQIQKAASTNKARITPSDARRTTTRIEALSPTRFELDLGDEGLNESFAAKKRITADWRFISETGSSTQAEQKPPLAAASARSSKSGSVQDWSVKAIGRTLVQFAPQPGELRLAVQLGYDGQRSNSIQGKLTIQPQKGNLARLIALEELVLMVVSFAIALASGLILYYVPEPHFGSLQDYLALFTWGVGVDQGKNLVQTFQNLRSQAKAEPSK